LILTIQFDVEQPEPTPVDISAEITAIREAVSRIEGKVKII
jgi:hypothetical protein